MPSSLSRVTTDTTSPSGPSSQRDVANVADNYGNEDKLLSVFSAQMTPKQVRCILRLSGNDFDASMECLIAGPTSESIIKLMTSKYKSYRNAKLHVDEDEAWSDLVAFYKAPTPDPLICQIRICLLGQPTIDTGGVRRQLYTSVFQFRTINMLNCLMVRQIIWGHSIVLKLDRLGYSKY